MGNINQYTNLGFASVCIQVYISHIINWLGYIIYVIAGAQPRMERTVAHRRQRTELWLFEREYDYEQALLK